MLCGIDDDDRTKAAREAIAAARKAIAEGEEIVRETREFYGLTHRHRRPLTRAWERGDYKRLKEPEPEHALSEWDYAAIGAVRHLLDLAATTRKPGLRAACYREAGHHLGRLRYRSGHRNAPRRERWEWMEIVKGECKIGQSRAYELISLAKGRKTVAEHRAQDARRQRRSRAKKRDKSDVTESPDKGGVGPR